MKDKKNEDKLDIITADPSGVGEIIKKTGLIINVGAASSRESVYTLIQCFRNLMFLAEDIT